MASIMSTGPKKIENRGGKREGAGRKNKRYELSQKQIDKLLEAADKKAESEGKSIPEVLVSLIYQDDAKTVQMSALKLFYENVITKAAEKDVNINENLGPQIGLPETKPDPAKVVAISGGKDKT